jgi:hypothetical protein
MTRPIRWELIEQNYGMLVKYATAIRVGTALALEPRKEDDSVLDVACVPLQVARGLARPYVQH